MLQLSLSTLLTSPTTPGAGFVPALSGDFSAALAGIAEAAAASGATVAAPATPRQAAAEPGKSLPIAAAVEALSEADLAWPDHVAMPAAPETDAATNDGLEHTVMRAAPAAVVPAAIQPSATTAAAAPRPNDANAAAALLVTPAIDQASKFTGAPAQVVLAADLTPSPAAMPETVADAPAPPVSPDAAAPAPMPKGKQQVAVSAAPDTTAAEAHRENAVIVATGAVAARADPVSAKDGDPKKHADAPDRRSKETPIEAPRQFAASVAPIIVSPIMSALASAPTPVRAAAALNVRPIVAGAIGIDAPAAAIPPPTAHPADPGLSLATARAPTTRLAESIDAATATTTTAQASLTTPSAIAPAPPTSPDAVARNSVSLVSGAAVRPIDSIVDAPRAADVAAQPIVEVGGTAVAIDVPTSLTVSAPAVAPAPALTIPSPIAARPDAVTPGHPAAATRRGGDAQAAAPGRPIAVDPMPPAPLPVSSTTGPVPAIPPAHADHSATLSVSAPPQIAPAAPSPRTRSDEASPSATRAADGVAKPDMPATPVVNAPARPVSIPQPAQPAAIAFGVAFGGIAPGQRPLGDSRPSPREQALQALATLAGAAGPAAPIAAPAQAQHGALDMRRDDWPQAMIDRIEALRDAADAISTRISLAPDALGKVDLSIRHDGSTVHVHFSAEAAQTRAILADAQPKLADLAQQRGFRLGQATVDAGAGGGGQRQQPQAAAPTPQRPASAFASTPADADAADSTRLA